MWKGVEGREPRRTRLDQGKPEPRAGSRGTEQVGSAVPA